MRVVLRFLLVFLFVMATNGHTSPRLKNSDTKQDAVSNAIHVAVQDIERAAKDELQKQESILSSAVSEFGSTIRSGLSSLFAGSQEDVESMAVEVETEILKSAKHEIEQDAQDIETEAIGEIEKAAELKQENGATMEEVEQSVFAQQKETIAQVRTQIDTRAQEIRNKLGYRTAMVEKEVLEKRLSAQLGHNVELQILEDVEDGGGN